MRVIGITLLLIFLIVPGLIFAQQDTTTNQGTNANQSINTDFGSSYQGVENVSEQTAQQGGFVGSGRPSSFVGIDEIYSGGGTANASRATSSRRQTTTARTAVRSTTQRRTTTATGGARSNLLGSSNQFVRTVALIDFDVPASSWTPQATAESVGSSLKRIQGLQNSQITFQSSPTGTTAVLTGTVASRTERRVAEQRLLMEPGISRVENLLEIR